TEKYAHVTFFFNGGIEEPYAGETRQLIASPKVATYDLQPEMSATLLTDALVDAINSQQYDFILCNYANADMVGHSGDFAAAVKAIEAVDGAIGKITAAIEKCDGELLITADHGNAECMYDEVTLQPHTAHTINPVPLLYVGKRGQFLYPEGILADIAPTILRLFKLPVPKAMTGKVLLDIQS
ncbi:MAG: phosphoglycerate mutase, partial [Gammaproteobacteria bacterium]|nr:phosphoglycerate mutase [Gammaproteobacteria bacterium]